MQEIKNGIDRTHLNNNVVHFEKTNLMAHFYKDNIQVITPFINDFKTAIETLINK